MSGFWQNSWMGGRVGQSLRSSENSMDQSFNLSFNSSPLANSTFCTSEGEGSGQFFSQQQNFIIPLLDAEGNDYFFFFNCHSMLQTIYGILDNSLARYIFKIILDFL